MRILHVVVRSHRRGAEMAALELADELDRMGHHNRLVSLAAAFDGSEDPGIPPLVAGARTSFDVWSRCAWRLRRLVRREPVDVVIAHGGSAARVAAVALPRRGPLLVWQRILGFPQDVWKPTRRLFWRRVATRMHAAVALTPELGEELGRLGFAGPVWVIPNSRQPYRFEGVDRSVEGARLRRRIHVEPDVPLVGFVGHLIGQKRPERALAVLSGVRERSHGAHLVIAGDGPLREGLEREVRERKLEDHVSLLGHRNDVERVLGALDVLILTSESEGIPGVAIEAQMAGCPVVTFPLGGVADVVEDGVTGVVLPQADTSLMAERVAELFEDPGRRRAMSAEARRRTPLFAARRTAAVYETRLAELQLGRQIEHAKERSGGGLRIYWYWPFARAEDVGIARAAVRNGDRLLIQTVDRPGVPVSDPSDPYVVRSDVPEVRSARERSLRWVMSRAITYIGRVWARHRLLRSQDFDVVHLMFVNRFTDAFDLALLRRRHLVVCSVHDAYPHQPRLPAVLERRLTAMQFRGDSTLVVHNEGLRRILIDDFGVPRGRIEVVPHQVPNFSSAMDAAPDDPPLVLFFGALRRNKGVDVLLDAISQIERHDLRFHFAGQGFDDIEAVVLQSAQHDRRVTAELTWISPERKSDLYQRASLVVLPYTDFESESGVLHDAYGHGRPVVVTEVGSLGSEVRSSGTGWVVPARDPQALSGVIVDALDDPAGYERAAEAARDLARARRPEVVGRQLRDLYERLVRDRCAVSSERCDGARSRSTRK